MYFSKNEKDIISTFYRNLSKIEATNLTLTWSTGSIVATFDTCFDDDNGNEIGSPEYDSFVSFAFQAIQITGNPPVFVTDDDMFLIDYRNFPSDIFANDKKVN